jgi:two-component system cell cycle response regulator
MGRSTTATGVYRDPIPGPTPGARSGAAASPPAEERLPAGTEIGLDGATILLVDDNLQNLELMQAYLEGLPCEIRTVTDGLEAVRSIERHQPDLVLLDVMMPRMSGFEVCQKIKSSPRTRDIPVIMVTALHEVGDIERAVESGTDDFLTKPVNKLELLTRVRSLLRVRLLKKRLDQMASLTSRIGPDTRARLEAGEMLE